MSFIKNLSPVQKRFLILAVLAVLVGGSFMVHKLTTSTPKITKADNTISNKKASKTGQDNNNVSSSGDTSSNSNKNTATNSSGEELVAPYGNFISSHFLSLSKAGNANLESLCNTTPGASCTI